MAVLTLTDIDEHVLDALRDRAASNARSIEAEAGHILAAAVGAPRSRADLWDEVRRIAAMTPKGVPQTDSVELLHEDRGRS